MKVDNIFLNANYDNKRISTYDGDSNTTLGEYKTKERAIEILDEIQNIFSLNIKNKHYDEADLILKAKMLDSCYEMPEE